MADVKWIKIVTDIFDDEKILLIESLPEADSIIVIWFKLLCLAGKQNNSGVFQIADHIPYTDEMFATIFRRKINTVRLALSTFEQYGMIEIINNTVTIPNWGKHQSIEQMEARREYQRQYHVEYRKKQKMLAAGNDDEDKDLRKHLREGLDKGLRKPTVNTPDKNRLDEIRGDENKEHTRAARESAHDRFDDFWAVYPRKVSKQTARKAWASGKLDSIADSIIEDVQKRIDTEWKGADMQFIPHPTTYIHQRRWEDETPPQQRKERTQLDSRPQDNPALNYAQREYKDEDFGDDFYMFTPGWAKKHPEEARQYGYPVPDEKEA